MNIGFELRPLTQGVPMAYTNIFYLLQGVLEKCNQDCLTNISGYKHARWLKHTSFEIRDS